METMATNSHSVWLLPNNYTYWGNNVVTAEKLCLRDCFWSTKCCSIGRWQIQGNGSVDFKLSLSCSEGHWDPSSSSASNLKLTDFGYLNGFPRDWGELFNNWRCSKAFLGKPTVLLQCRFPFPTIPECWEDDGEAWSVIYIRFPQAPITWSWPIPDVRNEALETEMNFSISCSKAFLRKPTVLSRWRSPFPAIQECWKEDGDIRKANEIRFPLAPATWSWPISDIRIDTQEIEWRF